MSKIKLPEVKNFAKPKNLQFEAPADILNKWAASPQADAGTDPTVISIFEVIGEDWWTGGGWTAKRMQNALKAAGDNPVTVKINSPGGDMFEGIAIYNLLRAHPNTVTIEVVGIAASAASIIAMTGDDIRMGLGTFMMVHNAWGIVVGNRHEMREYADLFEQFDSALVDIYEARTGRKRADIETLMDAETFMSPSTAVEEKFADGVDEGIVTPKPDDEPENEVERAIFARRRIEAGLAKAGYTRGDREKMLTEFSPAARDAGRAPAARDAGVDLMAVQRLIATMKQK